MRAAIIAMVEDDLTVEAAAAAAGAGAGHASDTGVSFLVIDARSPVGQALPNGHAPPMITARGRRGRRANLKDVVGTAAASVFRPNISA
jgi:hypothetical protein